MKKIIIIGGGIAGLSAGVLALRCGFDVTILESHSIAGGNCTAWKRNGYLFECGMHWLAGTRSQDPLNELWYAIGALNDDVTIHYSEPYTEYDYNGIPIRLYRDVDKTEQHLLAISPADEKRIKAFCDSIRSAQSEGEICDNIRNAQSEEELEATYQELTEQYINQFSHEGIRELLRAFQESEAGISIVFTLAYLASGNGGFPGGGSLSFVRRIVNTFKSLGGEIRYNTHADRVVIKNGKATSVKSGDELFPADAVIIASDTMNIAQFFDVLPQSSWFDEMQAVTAPTMCTLVSLGINVDLKNYPESLIFKLEEPICLADHTHQYLSFSNYAADSTYSPKGKTALTVHLAGDTYDFWKKAKEESRYIDEKQKIANQVISAIIAQIPEAEGQIEVCDVATPLTFERYCGTWQGSWMTAIIPGMRREPYPVTIEGLDGVYFAGHRMTPPGGHPIAAESGMTAVQQLCHDTDTVCIWE